MEKTEMTLFAYQKTSRLNFREINLLSKEAVCIRSSKYESVLPTLQLGQEIGANIR